MIALAPRCALVVFYLVAIGAFVIRKQALRPQTSLFLKQIKLPIVQIYEEGELKDEFICGNDMRGEPLRLKETLNSRTKESCSTGYIENMYSDDMLAGVKEEKKTFVLKIYRDGCQVICKTASSKCIHAGAYLKSPSIPPFSRLYPLLCI